MRRVRYMPLFDAPLFFSFFAGDGEGTCSPLLFTQEGELVALVLLLLLLILILGGVGIAAAKLLLWIALILLVVWIVGFFARGAEGARWYRW